MKVEIEVVSSNTYEYHYKKPQTHITACVGDIKECVYLDFTKNLGAGFKNSKSLEFDYILSLDEFVEHVWI